MAESETSKPQKGFWNLTANDKPKHPKVSFEINITETVKFLQDEPREEEGEDGVYYTFPVIHKDVETVIQTSAWTLLTELKKHKPLKDKELKITKKLEKGKQYFVVLA